MKPSTINPYLAKLAAPAVALAVAGCAHDPYAGTVHTKEGAVWGGLLGAAAGGIIGNQSGRGLEGAAIGAAAGAGAGALYGSSRDEAEARYAPPPPAYQGSYPPPAYQGGYPPPAQAPPPGYYRY